MHIRVKTGELHLITMIITKICLEHLSVRNHNLTQNLSSLAKKMVTNIFLRRALMTKDTMSNQWECIKTQLLERI